MHCYNFLAVSVAAAGADAINFALATVSKGSAAEQVAPSEKKAQFMKHKRKIIPARTG
jgi:hypothetical protein